MAAYQKTTQLKKSGGVPVGQGAGLCLRNHSKGSSRVNVGSGEKITLPVSFSTCL